MASGTTDRGKYQLLKYSFDATTVPSTYYLALFTSATSPTKATNTMSQLTEIGAGNGYVTGGSALTADTDFTVAEEDSTVGASAIVSNVTWTASGGNIPASGDGARWAALMDGNTSSANIIAYFDLSSDRTVSDTQTLTIQACEIDLNEPS